jgi:hypothetical protein
MKFANARELDRKSGCTLGRTWGTRPWKRPCCLLKGRVAPLFIASVLFASLTHHKNVILSGAPHRFIA